MKLRRLLTVSTLAAVATAVAAPPAGALIVPQRSISGIKLDMTRGQVESALGRPLRTDTGRNEFGPFTTLVYRGGLSVNFQGNRGVTAITVTGNTDRTSGGVGVGSTEQRVRDRVRGANCQTFGGFRSCTVGSTEPGRRVTEFRIRNGRVSAITYGIVID